MENTHQYSPCFHISGQLDTVNYSKPGISFVKLFFIDPKHWSLDTLCRRPQSFDSVFGVKCCVVVSVVGLLSLRPCKAPRHSVLPPQTHSSHIRRAAAALNLCSGLNRTLPSLQTWLFSYSIQTSYRAISTRDSTRETKHHTWCLLAQKVFLKSNGCKVFTLCGSRDILIWAPIHLLIIVTLNLNECMSL